MALCPKCPHRNDGLRRQARFQDIHGEDRWRKRDVNGDLEDCRAPQQDEGQLSALAIVLQLVGGDLAIGGQIGGGHQVAAGHRLQIQTHLSLTVITHLNTKRK